MGMLFVIDSNYYAGAFHSGGALRPDGSNPSYGSPATYESGNIYTIKKIYKEDPTEITWEREDRYRIILDKNIPFSAQYSTTFTANLTAHPVRAVASLTFSSFHRRPQATTISWLRVPTVARATRARVSASKGTRTTTVMFRARSL